MKTWFITGIARGLGQSLARAALSRGDRVVGTARGEVSLPAKENQLLVLQADLSDEKDIGTIVDEAFKWAGRIDVIVNNAGYGLLGAVEDASDAEISRLFQVNVFSPIQIVRSALPYLRRQACGHIINITSIAGRAPGAGIALYASTKYAMEGFSTSLAQEVAPHGIKVTAIAPGQFRTDFLADTSVRKSQISGEAYSDTVGRTLVALSEANHKQVGDPDRAAAAMLEVVDCDQPPLHLLLGTDAAQRFSMKNDQMLAETNVWLAITASTDFDSP